MEWTTISPEFWKGDRAALNPAGERRVDAYFAWAEVTKYADLGGIPKKWFPVVIEVPEKGATARAFCAMVERRKWDRFIKVPAMYAKPTTSLKKARFLTAIVTREFLSALEDEDGELAAAIERFELGLPVITADDVRTRPPEPPKPVHRPQAGEPQQAKAIVGIIDDGIAFAHERFREPGKGTRFDYFWNQDGALGSGPGYGHEIAKRQIDALLASSNIIGTVVDDDVYRRAGYANVARRLEHGTHVADFACGEDPGTVTPGAPRIIAVQLKVPGRLTRGTCGLWLTVHALDALRYILDRAGDYRTPEDKQTPVVVNLSFGYFAGPHDGTSMLEMAIDEMIDLHGRLAVVIPAGNSYLLRSHARFRLDPGGQQSLEWRLLPDDLTPSFVEIWPNDPAASLVVDVETPNGLHSGPVRAGEVKTLVNGNAEICTIVFPKRVTNGGRTMILVAMAPTTSANPRRVTSGSGVWIIHVRNAGTACTIDAWIQRDDTPPGFPTRGRQSRFEDPAYMRFDKLGRIVEIDEAEQSYGIVEQDGKREQSYVKREGTLNSLATGRNTIIVGGTSGSDGRPTIYSSKGSLERAPSGAEEPRDNPDLVTVSDDSIAHQGRIGAGSRSGSAAAMNGTSVAAPQVTRLIADLMPRLERYDRKTIVTTLLNELTPKSGKARTPQVRARPESVSQRPPQSEQLPPVNRLPRRGTARYR
jgi:hypothetical protein